MPNIIQIDTHWEEGEHELAVMGLSDDSKVYYWDYNAESWVLYGSSTA